MIVEYPDSGQEPVIIVGADGETGHRLALLLRRAGRSVVGVCGPRHDAAFYARHGIEIVVADPTDRESAATPFAGRGPCAVVCLLGGTPRLNSQGNINIIDAAAGSGATRFILLTSVGCGDSEATLDPFVKAFIGKALRHKNWAEARLRATELPWTIVRPGGTVRRPGTGEPILVDSPHVSGYINLTDLGDLLFQVVQSPKTVGRTLAAVDRGRAFDVNGLPVEPAKL